MRRHRSLAQLVFYVSLPIIFLFLILVRPPSPFYVLPLAPIALAAMLHGFAGGTLAALAAMAGPPLLWFFLSFCLHCYSRRPLT